MIIFIKRPLVAIRSWRSRQTSAALLIATGIGLAAPSVVHAKANLQESWAPQRTTVSRESRNVRLDHSGGKRVGMASYYGREFYGRKMADGTPMRPYSDSAASRTLPLGTKAKVVSLKDGKAALVTIRDRGPYARGRIIDLSPGTARQLGIIKAGVASVAVTPITVPQLDGTTKWVVALCQPERAEVIALAAGAPYSRLVKAC